VLRTPFTGDGSCAISRWLFGLCLARRIVTAVAALSLGLGIGSNAAIYSIYHRMLRQDLRVPQPERLVNLSAPGPKQGGTSWWLGRQAATM
jgi:hypothetical protein